MNYEQYAPLALRTAKFIDHATDLRHAYMGLITEVGELVDCLKRHYIYGKPLDLVNLSEEVGDVFWYLNLLWHVRGDRAAEKPVLYATTPLIRANDNIDFVIRLARITSDVAANSAGTQFLQTALEYLCVNYKIDVGSALDKNIAKLAARYGDKYSDYAALNRDLTVERVVLEAKAA